MFIQRLIANPALQSFSPLQREEQIYQFLTVNSAQLYPTLSSQAFFQGKSWETIITILLAVLYETTNELVVPELRMLVNKLDLTFFSFLSRIDMNESKAKQVIIEILDNMLASDQARRVFAGSLTAINMNILKKFIVEIFHRKKYVHFEI